MSFPDLDDDTRDRLKSELLKIRQAAVEDKETIEKQAARIATLEGIVEDAHSRLLEIRKEILVESANQTGKIFRDHVAKQLRELRAEYVRLSEAAAASKSAPSKGSRVLGKGCGTPAHVSARATAADDRSDEKKEEIKTDLPSSTPMKTPSASASPLLKTSQYTAAACAMESSRVGTDRLFVDKYASAFAGEYGPSFLNGFAKDMNVSTDYLATFVAFRTKYIDDRVIEATTKNGINQVVVLSAGCDTRAYRLNELPATSTVFYVDSATRNAHRQGIFAKEGIETTCKEVVNVDSYLTGDGLKGDLEKNGFKCDEKSIFVVEGVLPYLAESVCKTFLRRISGMMASGSVLVGDLPNSTNVNLKVLHDAWANYAERVVFGDNCPEEFLNGFGLKKEDFTFLGHGRSNYQKRSNGEFLAHMESAAPSKDDAVARIYLFSVVK